MIWTAVAIVILATVAFVTVAMTDAWRPAPGKLFIARACSLANVGVGMALLYLLIFHK